jgi:hypothetical protein
LDTKSVLTPQHCQGFSNAPATQSAPSLKLTPELSGFLGPKLETTALAVGAEKDQYQLLI